MITDIIVEVFFLLEICVNFFTSYYDSDNNHITSNKLIALHYLKGWFIIDGARDPLLLPRSDHGFCTHFSSCAFSRILPRASRLAFADAGTLSNAHIQDGDSLLACFLPLSPSVPFQPRLSLALSNMDQSCAFPPK
jgi:hypothetical protein